MQDAHTAARVLITGTSRGLGREMARHYAAAGWQVLASCRNTERAPELMELAQSFTALRVVQLDVTSSDTLARLGAELGPEPLDLLIHNAGTAVRERDLSTLDHASWTRTLQVNAFAILDLARTFSAHLARSQQRRFVVIGSQMGSITQATGGGRYAYRASKAAANMLVKILADELASLGITVVSIHPGWARTGLGGPDAPLSPAQSVALIHRVIAQLTARDTGRFLDTHGHDIPW